MSSFYCTYHGMSFLLTVHVYSGTFSQSLGLSYTFTKSNWFYNIYRYLIYNLNMGIYINWNISIFYTASFCNYSNVSQVTCLSGVYRGLKTSFGFYLDFVGLVKKLVVNFALCQFQVWKFPWKWNKRRIKMT